LDSTVAVAICGPRRFAVSNASVTVASPFGLIGD
jgi:hypothetical protein